MNTKKSPHKLIIALPDYVRIFRVIHAVMGTTATDSDEACLFFSMAGSAILKHFYKKEARVMLGSAFYVVSDSPRTILSLTKNTNGELGRGLIESDKTGFHCWLECEGMVIDFQAPVFSEALARRGSSVRIPRQMFQRPKAAMSAAMSAAHDQLEKTGDFYLHANIALTNELVRAFFANPTQIDLMKGCMTWYTRPPKKISGGMTMRDHSEKGDGAHYEMVLSDLEVVGVW